MYFASYQIAKHQKSYAVGETGGSKEYDKK